MESGEGKRWPAMCPTERSLWFPAARFVDCVRSIVRTRLLRRTPRRPWLPYGAICVLWRELAPGDRVFEWGSGGSTIWFATLGARVHSVEHDRGWADAVRAHLREAGLAENVEIRTREPEATRDGGGRYASAREEYSGLSFRGYVEAIQEFPDGHFDLVVVDGRARPACLESAPPKLASGGLLLLDDSDRDRYRRAAEAFESWGEMSFTGLQPSKLKPGFTSIWRKP